MATTFGNMKMTTVTSLNTEKSHQFHANMVSFVLHAETQNVRMYWATGDTTDYIEIVAGQKETRDLSDLANRTVFFIEATASATLRIEEHLNNIPDDE